MNNADNSPDQNPDSPEPNKLTRADIEAIVNAEHQRARELFPDWVHPFTHLKISRARRSYGHAHQDGHMAISDNFIGTTAREDLLDTIRHEFAHLIVGIRHKHGPRWRAAAASLGAIPKASGRSRGEDLHQRMNDAPLTLIAVMQSGEERVMKRVFRRSRRYLDYRYSVWGDRYHIDGEFIERFRYRENH
ncbi:MAG: hypothetical protein Cons2KO_02230 [Congregibacter sp.]